MGGGCGGVARLSRETPTRGRDEQGETIFPFGALRSDTGDNVCLLQ